MKNKPHPETNRDILISFVIPIYNSSQYIEKTISSITKSMKNRNDYEIILIDDCSSDIEIIKLAIKNKINIKLIEKEVKSNASESRNIGICHSLGEFIFLLDSDDKILEGYIEHRIRKHKENSYGICFGNFLHNNKNQDVKEYLTEDFKKYLFIDKGDIRSSTISIYKKKYKGTLFDENQDKHQDWGFGINAYKNNENIGFDKKPLVIIDSKENEYRMSNSMNILASKYFIDNFELRANEICMFVRRHALLAIESSETESATFLKDKLKDNIYSMDIKYKTLSILYYLILCVPKGVAMKLLTMRAFLKNTVKL